MKSRIPFLLSTVFCFSLLLPILGQAQGTQADYERANGLRNKMVGLAVNVPEPANWIGKTTRFWYRKAVKGGNEFIVVNAETLEKKPAFDHAKLAEALIAVLPNEREKPSALKLPFSEITFVDDERAIEFNIAEVRWRCDLTNYSVKKKTDERGQRRGGGIPLSIGIPGPRYNFPQAEAKVSPDGKWEAWINNFNVWIRAKGKREGSALSFDGSEGNYYALASLVWSPDSKMIAAYRVRQGYSRKIQYVESSPADQTQPKYYAMDYAKPGDALDQPQPMLFHVESKKALAVDNVLFPNPYQLSRIEWRKDNRAFTFELMLRGGQLLFEFDKL